MIDEPRPSKTMQILLPIFRELAKRIDLYKPTGTVYLRLDINQGGITNRRIGYEDSFREGHKECLNNLCEDMKTVK